MIWFIALCIFIILLVMLTSTRFEIRTQITIEAPRLKVWQAIIEMDKYDQWNSQIVYLGGEVRVGEKLHLKLTVDGIDPYEIRPEIGRWFRGEWLAWFIVTGTPRIFAREHFFELEETKKKHTRIINREEFRGILAFFLSPFPVIKGVPASLEKMNQELKAYVER